MAIQSLGVPDRAARDSALSRMPLASTVGSSSAGVRRGIGASSPTVNISCRVHSARDSDRSVDAAAALEGNYGREDVRGGEPDVLHRSGDDLGEQPTVGNRP